MQTSFFSNQPHNVIFLIAISSSLQTHGLTRGSGLPRQLWGFVWVCQGTYLKQEGKLYCCLEQWLKSGSGPNTSAAKNGAVLPGSVAFI